jgi:hypothetical protein
LMGWVLGGESLTVNPDQGQVISLYAYEFINPG